MSVDDFQRCAIEHCSSPSSGFGTRRAHNSNSRGWIHRRSDSDPSNLCPHSECSATTNRKSALFLPVSRETVTLHNDQRVSLRLEFDPRVTSVPHLKARSLLSLAPELASLPLSAIAAMLPVSPSPSTSQSSPSFSEQLALVRLVPLVRLEFEKSGAALDECSVGVSGMTLEAAKIVDQTSLVLDWGAPATTGKANIKFHVRVGEMGAVQKQETRKDEMWIRKNLSGSMVQRCVEHRESTEMLRCASTAFTMP